MERLTADNGAAGAIDAHDQGLGVAVVGDARQEPVAALIIDDDAGDRQPSDIVRPPETADSGEPAERRGGESHHGDDRQRSPQ